MDWKLSTSHTERYARGTPADALRARAYAIAKHGLPFTNLG